MGRAERLQRERQQVLAEAYALHPERFVHGIPTPPAIPTEVWINQPENTVEVEPVLTN